MNSNIYRIKINYQFSIINNNIIQKHNKSKQNLIENKFQSFKIKINSFLIKYQLIKMIFINNYYKVQLKIKIKLTFKINNLYIFKIYKMSQIN